MNRRERIERGLHRVEEVVEQVVAIVGKPAPGVTPGGKRRSRHASLDERALIVAKVVRLASGMNAALYLLDAGYLIEAATLLRTCDEFVDQLHYLSEIEPGENAKERRDLFITQQFSELPDTSEALADLPWERPIGRKDYDSSTSRIIVQVNEVGAGELAAKKLRDAKRFLRNGLDGYVHGRYWTAMELFDLNRQAFRLRGIGEAASSDSALTTIENQVIAALIALADVARGLGEMDLAFLLHEMSKVYMKAQAEDVQY